EDVLAERLPHAFVEGLELAPSRGDLHGVGEGAGSEDGRLPVAHAVAMGEPMTPRLLAEVFGLELSGDARGLVTLHLAESAIALPDEHERGSAEYAIRRPFDHAVELPRVLERADQGAHAEPG